MHAERETVSVFEGGDGGSDLQDGVADGSQSMVAVRSGKKFGLDKSRWVGEGHEFHGFTGGLFYGALLHDEATAGDFFSHMVSEVGHRTVCIPGDIRVEVEGMAADWKADQFHFIA